MGGSKPRGFAVEDSTIARDGGGATARASDLSSEASSSYPYACHHCTEQYKLERWKNREGNGRLRKRCGLPHVTPNVSSLPAQAHGNTPAIRRAVRGRRLTNKPLACLITRWLNTRSVSEQSLDRKWRRSYGSSKPKALWRDVKILVLCLDHRV